MKEKPTRRFLVVELVIQAIGMIRPLEEKIRRHDKELAEQIRTAINSVALNLGEGSRSQGGGRLARYHTSAGSNEEVRVALRVAAAWGYVDASTTKEIDARLDRVAAILWSLGARR